MCHQLPELPSTTSAAVRSTIRPAVGCTGRRTPIRETLATGTTVSATIDCTGRRPTIRETLATGTTIRATIDCTGRRPTIRETLATSTTIRTSISTPVRRTGCCASVSQTLAVAGRGRHVVVVQTHDAAPSESAGASLVRTVEPA
jgi:hypothetical protein